MEVRTTNHSFPEVFTDTSETEWVRCPICGSKTRTRVRKDTVLVNFPLHCPKCKNTSLIDVKDSKIEVLYRTS